MFELKKKQENNITKRTNSDQGTVKVLQYTGKCISNYRVCFSQFI